ncbi:MAG: Rid family detoxifying hydrolase [Liquorilactobacillus nagelii]|jgi:2-iminobutanoate/2-iminopropanoate deaminase|uniref:RidA family protein n=1 Tax=Liquorilactobacillus nagelii TaxID=82688 RepID=UPI00242C4EB5|nr:Rid family detoxifying hydrolase [Liquorilactobacillus nagelii]MCI1633744.1 Rid family detoxifying hydrolase [Liquorilactobacillus nagelii]MCI1921613.1 Rid family detoxifying hydrolase [Liquorilactobacillus nagelii]MCI1977261.1 Rid family detoxifying hydrolase [Liquorilactobacillus nagelii]
MKQALTTSQAPTALGAYSQATVCGPMVYCSGQIGLDPKTKQLANGVQQQAQQALHNLKEVLAAAELTPAAIVKVTVFMTNIADFQEVNQVYADFFAGQQCLPARSAVGIQALPAGALVEIEAIAQKDEGK